MLSIAPKGPPSSAPGPSEAAAHAAVPGVPEPPAQSDNRASSRRPATALPGITGLRISPHGVEATLVNISETGVLAECGERLKPGSNVTVVFEGTFQPRTMEGRVARNSVSSMGADGRLRYHVGIAFARPIELPPEERAPVVEEAPPSPVASVEPPPAVEAPAAVVVSPVPAAAAQAEASAAAAEPAEVIVPIVFPKAVRNRW